MRKQKIFLPADCFFLTESGVLRPNGSPADRPLADCVLIIARGLCRFEFFPVPPSLGARAAERAALLACETKAPFANSGSAVVRGILGFGLWWWDDARLAELLPPGSQRSKIQVFPESLLHGVSEGARILKLRDGYEAQIWNSATLVASFWRRREFDSGDWAMFLETVSAVIADAAMPEVQIGYQPAALKKLMKSLVVQRPPTWKQIERAAYLVCFLLAAPALFFVAQSLRYEAMRVKDNALAQAARAEINSAQIAAGNGLWNEVPLLQELSGRSENNPTLAAFAALTEVLSAHGKEFESAVIENGGIQIELANVSGAELEPISSALEAGDVFRDVKPQLDSATGKAVVTASACRSPARPGCTP